MFRIFATKSLPVTENNQPKHQANQNRLDSEIAQKQGQYSQTILRYYSQGSDEKITGDQFEQNVRLAYASNVIVYRSIQMIAMSASTIEWQLKHKQDGTQLPSEFEKRHLFYRLLQRPNAMLAGREFIRQLIIYRMISGNVFIQRVRDKKNAFSELYVLRPDRMEVVSGRGAVPRKYRYQIESHIKEFPVNPFNGESDILHWKYVHPMNDWLGLSPLKPIAYAILQHNSACEWNDSLLRNAARPSGIIMQDREAAQFGGMSDAQRRQLSEQIDQVFAGKENAGRPILLEGGFYWKDVGYSPREMDFIESKNAAARDIALGLGVPPQLLGIPGDNTYSNLQEARLYFWEQTMLPLLDELTDHLNHWLAKQFSEEGDVLLSYNKDAISALAPRRDALWQRINQANFLSDDEKRQMVVH